MGSLQQLVDVDPDEWDCLLNADLAVIAVEIVVDLRFRGWKLLSQMHGIARYHSTCPEVLHSQLAHQIMSARLCDAIPATKSSASFAYQSMTCRPRTALGATTFNGRTPTSKGTNGKSLRERR
jgi:hypothetical protein